MEKVFLFSQGGSGTEYTLLNFDWNEGLYSRHQRTVNFRNKEDKFVYIFNNPINILMSFERRGFFEIKGAVNNLQGDVSFKPPMKLSQIADSGLDYFHFQDHFERFMSQKNKGLFIKFEGLDVGWNEIEKFTSLKRKTEFAWKQKGSSLETHSDETISKLKNIYGDWISRYNEMPNFFYNK
jgi:hypothetical protein